MLVRLSSTLIAKPVSSGAVRLLTVPHRQKVGRRVEGENNTQKHQNTPSASPLPTHSEADRQRGSKFPVDPQCHPSDYGPQVATSGDYNRPGSRTAEYSHVDRKEPYSPPGGEQRYGAGEKYEWNAERLEKESKEPKEG